MPRAGAKPLPRKRPEEPPESGEKVVEAKPALKLRRLQIRNYKALDELDLEIPAPRLPGEPDVLVIGSRNGVGKTSVLETCALLGLVFRYREEARLRLPDHYREVVRTGALVAQVDLAIDADGHRASLAVDIPASGASALVYTPPRSLRDRSSREQRSAIRTSPPDPLFGLGTDPFVAPPVLYFHSHRRVSSGNVDLRDLLDGGPTTPQNVFKHSVVHALMSRAKLFEDVGAEDADRALDKLNELMAHFAGVTIEKLRPSPDNAIELRVSPVHGGPSYAFDGLSSGQKEIISTLFLIWKYTQNQPCIVLIDEPELHLNAEWHAELIGALLAMAPHNQYILATHSEDVFASVSAERRVLIAPAVR